MIKKYTFVNKIAFGNCIKMLINEINSHHEILENTN